MTSRQYPGGELVLFQTAHNWKRYFASRIRPYISGDVLEVGAGLGGSTPHLIHDGVSSWTALEPDPALASELSHRLKNDPATRPARVLTGMLGDVPAGSLFDVILYLDVLEHIEDDREELRCATRLLRPGGRLIILAPAHQGLYSRFDAAIGHHRRYDRESLTTLIPGEYAPVCLEYLDAAGMLLSWLNRALLRQDMPRPAQIRFWDGCVIPVSRILDRLTAYRLGKSILGIWRRA